MTDQFTPIINRIIREDIIPATFEYDYPTDADELRELVYREADSVIMTMDHTDMMNILTEYGVHEAYQLYYSCYGGMPEYMTGIVYAVIMDVYDSQHAEPDMNKYMTERRQWLMEHADDEELEI